MRKVIAIFLIGLVCALPLNLWAAINNPAGTWTTISDKDGRPRSIVRISERNGVFYGRILKVFKRPGDTGFCQNCPGNFKGKPVKGLQILWGVKRKGRNEWGGGRILDPKIGKIYRVKLSLANNGRSLKVRGYVGISLLGRTQTWRRN